MVLLGLAAETAAASPQAAVPRLIFPVVGPATYTDDFGDPRGGGRHQGNDIMAPKKALAVAAEAGTVKFWTTSARAGCLLYLHGDSGTTYLYIHLNNDRTMANDNAGGCKPGVAFARGLESGARVEAGEPIGYVGDSGDADGIASHLHFEVHPGGGAAVDPLPHLKRAQKLLFAAKAGTTVKLTMRGTIVDALYGSVALKVDQLRRYPGGLKVAKVGRTVELVVPPETQVFSAVGALIGAAKLPEAAAGRPAVVWTQPQPTTLDAQLGVPFTLAAERIDLRD